MTTWTSHRIGDLGRVLTGRTPPTKHAEYFGGEYPFYTPADLTYGDRRAPAERSLSEAGCNHMKSLLLPVGSVCCVCIGATIGKLHYTAVPSFTNQQLNSVVVDEARFDSRFVYYLLLHNRPRIQALAAGTYTRIINKSVFSSIEVRAPELEAQREIADILSAYDDLIENNNRRMALLGESVHLLYREWFVRLRFPGHERVKVVDGVPDGWDRVRLGDVVVVNSENISVRSPPDFIEYVDISSVSKGRIDGTASLSWADAPSRARRKVRHGDVIWAMVRPANRAYAVVFHPPDNLLVSTGFAVLRPERTTTSYLYAMATTDEFVGHMASVATGASYPAVKPGDFEAVEMLRPSGLILDAYNNLTEPLLLTMDALRRQNAKLEAARDALLPRLLNGSIAA